MGLVYEHWRPDKNVCFYVGASCIGESRAKNFSARNPEHLRVLLELEAQFLEPFHKIIWKDLQDDCTGTYEKIRIAYQKSLSGNELTNIARGGFGVNVEWTEEIAEKHRKACKLANNRPEVKEKQRKIQPIVQNLPEVNAKRSASLRKANAILAVKERRSQAAVKAHARAEVKALREAKENTEELRAKRKISARLGGLKAGQKSPEELSARGRKAAETRRLRKLEKQNV